MICFRTVSSISNTRKCVQWTPIARRLFSTKNILDPKQNKEDHNYCVDLVRERDREGYLCGLLMPQKARRAYFAIRAFNAELASVKDSYNIRKGGQARETSATFALQLRMQWWRDAIDQIYGSDPPTNAISISCWQNPVVRSLYASNEETWLTKRFLERLIDAREADLDINQYSTLQDLANYCEESVSSLLYLSLECTGVRDDEADLVASHAGVGIGLVTALRGTPFRLMHGELPIPADLLYPGFPYNQLLQQPDDRHLMDEDASMFKDAVKQIAYTASVHLAEARDHQSKIPRQGKASLLPVVPAFHFLSKLTAVDYNLFDPKLNDQSRLRVLLLLARTWLTGVI